MRIARIACGSHTEDIIIIVGRVLCQDPRYIYGIVAGVGVVSYSAQNPLAGKGLVTLECRGLIGTSSNVELL